MKHTKSVFACTVATICCMHTTSIHAGEEQDLIRQTIEAERIIQEQRDIEVKIYSDKLIQVLKKKNEDLRCALERQQTIQKAQARLAQAAQEQRTPPPPPPLLNGLRLRYIPSKPAGPRPCFLQLCADDEQPVGPSPSSNSQVN